MALNQIVPTDRLNKKYNPITGALPVTVAEANTIIDQVNDILDGTSAVTKVTVGSGTVSLPSITFSGDTNTGIYRIGADNIGVAVAGAKVLDISATGVVTKGNEFKNVNAVAINVTAAATAAEMVSGYITSTSAAAVAITTPTATAIAALIPGCARGTQFDLVIDNSAGANTVTLTLDASIAVVTPAITGGATLTVSTANAIGIFRIVFTSGTTAKIFRIA